MKANHQVGVTFPAGFLAGATCAGIKEGRNLDLGIIYSEQPCVAAGVFTTNKIKAAPVLLCQKCIGSNIAQAVVVNSGCANACTGEQGMADAQEMAALTADKLGVASKDVLVASTGLIGMSLPMERIRNCLGSLCLSEDGGDDLAKAIMTTDTVPKQAITTMNIGGKTVHIGGCAKGAGMIHPNMATLLAFITTDAAIEHDVLQQSLREAVDESFNMVSVDGDTSTNDTVLLLANGVAANKSIRSDTPEADLFLQGLCSVCTELAKGIARDAEGASKLIEVNVQGAASSTEARTVARTIASSSLVKTAIYGCDPNWGRVIAAVGRSGVEVVESKIDLYFGDTCLL
ncbi:MAG: bifunctional glutamate N-acetyltransferase/amino-acid acetyltransferase ArgJ, partial [Chloroflexota bacterium]|nr:bifunctional glutamate N-acetyltransferase/amino-acid acetyltransferase ArgJ [Chloroflexota bacterium]